jgi:hypothetical protein
MLRGLIWMISSTSQVCVVITLAMQGASAVGFWRQWESYGRLITITESLIVIQLVCSDACENFTIDRATPRVFSIFTSCLFLSFAWKVLLCKMRDYLSVVPGSTVCRKWQYAVGIRCKSQRQRDQSDFAFMTSCLWLSMCCRSKMPTDEVPALE